MRKNAGFLILATLILLGGCQAIFTFSPLSGLQRDPANMPPEQRLQYAKDALASGDTDAMLAAYNAILNDTGADAQYTAAQLGIEISGVPTLLVEIADDTSSLSTQLDDIDNFIASHGLDPGYMADAGLRLESLQAAGEPLTTMDYVMGAVGLLLDSTGGTWDIETQGHSTDAQALLNHADVSSLSADDPLRQMVDQLNLYLAGIPA